MNDGHNSYSNTFTLEATKSRGEVRLKKWRESKKDLNLKPFGYKVLILIIRSKWLVPIWIYVIIKVKKVKSRFWLRGQEKISNSPTVRETFVLICEKAIISA